MLNDINDPIEEVKKYALTTQTPDINHGFVAMYNLFFLNGQVWNLTFHPVKIANLAKFMDSSVILSFWPQWCKHKALSSPPPPCCRAVHASISAVPRIAQRLVIAGDVYSSLALFDRYLLTTTDMFCTVDDFKDTQQMLQWYAGFVLALMSSLFVIWCDVTPNS